MQDIETFIEGPGSCWGGFRTSQSLLKPSEAFVVFYFENPPDSRVLLPAILDALRVNRRGPAMAACQRRRDASLQRCRGGRWFLQNRCRAPLGAGLPLTGTAAIHSGCHAAAVPPSVGFELKPVTPCRLVCSKFQNPSFGMQLTESL